MLTFLVSCALLFIVGIAKGQNYSDNDAQILILGSGPAGLLATSILLGNEITDFILLEGETEPYGTLKSSEFGGIIMATGAPWAHVPGKPNIDGAGYTSSESNFESYVVRNDSGVDVTSEYDDARDKWESAMEQTDAIAKDTVDCKRQDVDYRTGLATAGWIADTPVENVLEWFQIDLDYGRGTREMSIVGPYEQDFGGDERYFILDPNGTILNEVVAQLDGDHLRMNQIVNNIDQSGDRVVVTTQEGLQYTADYVLVTHSIGVLQQGSVTFTPELPAWKTEEIFRFQNATIDPILLKFPSKFWGDEEWILHAGERGNYSAFMNAEAEGLWPAGTNILIAFVTGEEAVRVEGLRDDEVQAEILDVLRGMYGANVVPDLDDFLFVRWATNPFHYGTQATWPISANVPADAKKRIQANVGRIFFANNAAPEFIGAVSGTFISSDIAMMAMLECLDDDGECPEYQPGDNTCVGPRPVKTRKVRP